MEFNYWPLTEAYTFLISLPSRSSFVFFTRQLFIVNYLYEFPIHPPIHPPLLSSRDPSLTLWVTDQHSRHQIYRHLSHHMLLDALFLAHISYSSDSFLPDRIAVPYRFVYAVHLGGSFPRTDVLGYTSWDKCGEGRIFDYETGYFYRLPLTLGLSTWRTLSLTTAHYTHFLPLPTISFDIRCGPVASSTPPLALIVAAAPIATASPSVREARFSR